MEDAKYRKALEKKLKFIGELKRKRESGLSLDEQQKAKLARESEILAELEALPAAAAAAAVCPVCPVAPPAAAAVAASPSASARMAQAPTVEVGMKLLVDGRKAKVKQVDLEGGRLKVKFSDDESKEWLRQDDERVSFGKDHGTAGKEAAPAAPFMPATPAATAAPSVPAATTTWPTPAPPQHAVTAWVNDGTRCGHCGSHAHDARTCSFGLEFGEKFLPCGSTDAVGCFTRTFIVPLRRAPPSFDADNPREGRVDVGLRCISSALFRSQSLRRNSRAVLCFGGTEPGRVVEVLGSMVRDLRPDEKNLSARLRAVADADGAAAAAAEMECAQRERTDESIGRWSRSETRGWISSEGDVQSALESALAVVGQPPTLMLLNATGTFIGDACAEMAVAAAGGPCPDVIVLLGDDRGLTGAEVGGR